MSPGVQSEEKYKKEKNVNYGPGEELWGRCSKQEERRESYGDSNKNNDNHDCALLKKYETRLTFRIKGNKLPGSYHFVRIWTQ